MWTPKRVVLLAIGFALFSATYLVYAHFLGGINGLPPLPEDYGPIVGDHDPVLPERQENEADHKLRIAFGPDCDEVKNRNIKVELQSRGMVLASQDILFLDGRVKLIPFSLAIFGKEGNGEKFPEINTVQCHEAILTFDKPVNNIAEMANRKITGGQLSGDIRIINNRHTPQRDDDLSLLTQGPMYYEESLHRVWTGAVIEVMDLQSKPKPMVVRGTRMHLYLADDHQPAEPAKATAAKAKASSSMKVERIELESDVDMNLYVDARSGFLDAGKEDPESRKPKAESQNPKDAAPAEKAKVKITTQGPFRYDMLTDRATFDISHHSGPRPNVVTVERFHEQEEKYDRLECDHLEIQFQRKNPAAAQAARDDQAEGLDIETVRATGKEVVLTSDAEVLEAHGNDFFYDKKTHLSILKGLPRMWALKEGNEIEAPELQLLDVKGAQQATALGEGHIRMLDKKTGQRPLEAHWTKKLVYAKDGPYDLLWLTGNASFVDHEHAQELQAQQHLKVWLEPTKEGGSGASQPRPAASDPQRPLPHHVDALGQVKASAPNMRVHDTDHLVLWFKDVAPTMAPVGEAPATEKVADKPADPKSEIHPKSETRNPKSEISDHSDSGPAERLPARASQGAPAAAPSGVSSPLPASPAAGEKSKGEGASANAAADPAKPKNPMDLSAREVEAHVLRMGSKNELDKLTCVGTVRAVQEPSGPDDKGVDLRGEKLYVVRQADGNILTVLGDYAQVQLDKLFMVGPEINIDQTTNEAWAPRMGVMRLPSNATLGGTKLPGEAPGPNSPGSPQSPGSPPAKPAPPADVTIYWQERMLFDGQVARFWGDVRAEQNNGHLACRAMQVTLDRRISFREGDKSKQPAKVQQVICDRDVWVEDSKQEGSDIVAYERIDCPVLNVDNDEEKDDSVVNAGGPGTVRIFQVGTKGDVLPPPGGASAPATASRGSPGSTNAPSAKGKEEGERKLTRITYQGSMSANNKQGIAKFFDKVVVLQLPTDDPSYRIDENHLPPGYLYLSCERLEVLKNKLPDGKSYQEMRAYRKVAIETQEFSGSADVVKYDESKEQVILEGSDGNDAVLIKQKVRGAETQTLRGKKITYWRSTGNYHIEDGRGLRVDQ